MSLTIEQLRLRDGKVTASFLPPLMAGDETKIMSEWKRLVGDPSYAPENLDDIWPVQFGSWVEPFALDWHQRKTGRVLARRGEVVTHPTRPYVCCTLDAFRPDDGCVIDVKALGAYRKLDEACAYYTPQMVVQRDCVGGNGAALLIVHGGAEPVEHPIDIPDDYAAAVWQRIEWFWGCVQSLTEPVSVAAVAAPVVPVKTYDFTGNNLWSDHAATWLATKDHAKKFDGAVKGLKEIIPADAVKAHGHGIQANRSKSGAITIKQEA